MIEETFGESPFSFGGKGLRKGFLLKSEAEADLQFHRLWWLLMNVDNEQGVGGIEQLHNIRTLE